MASAGPSSAPLKLLHEGEGHVVTVELKTGEIYRGLLSEAEDTMNCHMREVTFTGKDGRVCRLERAFLRGGQIKFIVLPAILKEAPILKRVQGFKGKAAPASGKDKAAAAGKK